MNILFPFVTKALRLSSATILIVIDSGSRPDARKIGSE